MPIAALPPSAPPSAIAATVSSPRPPLPKGIVPASEVSIPEQVSQAASAAAATPQSLAGSSPMGISRDAWGNGFATLVGALLGSVTAFVLQAWYLRTDRRRKTRVALHKTLFSLFQQTNTVMSIQRDHVFPHLQHPLRFLAIPATQRYDEASHLIKIEDLTELLDAREGRKELYDLFLAQESYLAAINAWNLRSDWHRGEIQPKLSATTKLRNGSMVGWDDLEQGLGEMALGGICNLTEGVQGGLQHAFKKLVKATTNFRAFAVGQFPKEHFAEWDFPEKYGIEDPIEPIVPMPSSRKPRDYRPQGFYGGLSWSMTVPRLSTPLRKPWSDIA